MPAMEPPIFQSPVIIQTITKVTKEAVIRQVRVFAIDYCGGIPIPIDIEKDIWQIISTFLIIYFYLKQNGF